MKMPIVRMHLNQDVAQMNVLVSNNVFILFFIFLLDLGKPQKKSSSLSGRATMALPPPPPTLLPFGPFFFFFFLIL